MSRAYSPHLKQFILVTVLPLDGIKHKIKWRYSRTLTEQYSPNVRDVLRVLILIKAAPSIILASTSGGSDDELSNSTWHVKKSDFAVCFLSLPYSDNETG